MSHIQDVSEPAPTSAEVVFNLWYVYDDMGLIYSLRARAYVGHGTDEEKLELLRRFAKEDYLIAQPFPVPARFVLNDGQQFPVAPVRVLRELSGPLAMFEVALQQLEAQFPAQSRLRSSPSPLFCLTPLWADNKGNLEPRFENSTGHSGR